MAAARAAEVQQIHLDDCLGQLTDELHMDYTPKQHGIICKLTRVSMRMSSTSMLGACWVSYTTTFNLNGPTKQSAAMNICNRLHDIMHSCKSLDIHQKDNNDLSQIQNGCSVQHAHDRTSCLASWLLSDHAWL